MRCCDIAICHNTAFTNEMTPTEIDISDLPDDELLLNIACDEDRDAAFSVFYPRHSETMWSISSALCRGNGDFITKEALFNKLAEKIYRCTSSPSFPKSPEKSKKAVGSWIYVVAKNVLLEHLRGNTSIDTAHKNWTRSETPSERELGSFLNTDPEPLIIDTDDLSSEEIEAIQQSLENISKPSDEKKAVRDCVSQLSAKQQAVLWAKTQFYAPSIEKQELPSSVLDELEETLQIKRVSIAKTYQRAKESVKKCLQNKGIGDY
jgi:DNA-directed RNA polymerase specialized sigma24 family protein